MAMQSPSYTAWLAKGNNAAKKAAWVGDRGAGAPPAAPGPAPPAAPNYQQPLMQGGLTAPAPAPPAAPAPVYGGSGSMGTSEQRNQWQRQQQRYQQQQGAMATQPQIQPPQGPPQTGVWNPADRQQWERSQQRAGLMPSKDQVMQQQGQPQPQPMGPMGQQPMQPQGQSNWGPQQPVQHYGPQPMGQMAPPQQQGGMNIQSSIQPQTPYQPDFMRQAGNMAAAQAVPAIGDVRSQFNRPGISLGSNATQAGMGGAMGQMLGQGAANYAQGQQQMGWQNANTNLAGQQARNNEALGWGNLRAQGIQNQLGNQMGQQQNMLGFLRQAYGGM